MFEDVEEYKDPERDKNTYHFFYNEEERISKAPQIVKDYYDGKMKPLRGLQIFTKNKSNLFILLALVFFVGTCWVYSGFNKTRNYAKINDVDCNLTAFCYGDEIYVNVNLKKNPRSKKDFSNISSINTRLMAIDNNQQFLYDYEERIPFSGEEKIVRTKFNDSDIIRIDAIINVDGVEKELSSGVKR